MKQEQQEEFEDNESEQFRGKTYKEILEELKRLKKVTCETYVPALCVAYKREHINMENVEIKKQVMKDALSIGLWTESTITTYFPKWINRSYPMNTTKFRETLNSPEQKQTERTLETFSSTIDYIEKENEQAKEPEPTVGSYSDSISQPSKKPKPTPQELYEAGVTDAEKLWIDLTGLKSLITSDTTDALVDYIKPTEGYRLRIFKGLDESRSIHYQNCLIRLDMLIQRTLKMCQEINRENKQEVSN